MRLTTIFLVIQCVLCEEAKELTTLEEVESFIDDDHASVIGFYAPDPKVEGETEDGMIPDPNAKKPEEWDDEDDGDWAAPMIKKVTAADAFKEFAKTDYNSRFAVTSSEEVLTKYKLKNAIVVFKPPNQVSKKYGDKKRARYGSTKINNDALKTFTEQNSVPLVGLYNYKTQGSYTNSGLPIVKIFMMPDLKNNIKGTNYFLNRLRKVAKDYKGKFMFTAVSKDDYSYEIADYGVDKDALKRNDVFVGIEHDSVHYKMEGKFSSDNVAKFCAAFDAGELTQAERFVAPVADDSSDTEDDSSSEDTE